MYNVARKRFDEIFSDTSLYDTIRRPVDKISYYEYDIIEKSTGNKVGYFTETSYENTYKVVKRLITDEDISYHFNKIREYIDILESSAKRKYKPLDGRIWEFLDEGNIVPYDISSGVDFIDSFGDAWAEFAEKRKLESLERATYEGLSEFEVNVENIFMTYYSDGNRYELVQKAFGEYAIRVNGDERTSSMHKETILGLFRGCIEQREQVLKLLSLKIE